MNQSESDVDFDAVKVLNIFHPVMNIDTVLLKTIPEGNCMYTAVSLGLFGSQNHHLLLRLLISLELTCNNIKYDAMKHTSILYTDLAIVNSDWSTLVRSA